MTLHAISRSQPSQRKAAILTAVLVALGSAAAIAVCVLDGPRMVDDYTIRD